MTEQLFESGLNGFSISMDKVFFWNGFKVWYIDTNGIQDGYAFKEVGLLVSPNETQTKILKVRTGSDSSQIAILVR